MDTKIAPQNLIKQVSVETLARPAGHGKALTLDVFVVLSAILVSFLAKRSLDALDSASFAFLAGGFAIFAILSVLSLLLSKNMARRLTVILVETVALLAFFSELPLKYLAVLGIAVFAFLVWGEEDGRREMENSIEFKFVRSTRPQLNKIITAGVLLVVLLYLPQWDEKKSFLSPESFQGLYDWTAAAAKGFYPEVTLTGTIFEFAQSVARSELQGSPAFRELTVPAQERAVQESTQGVLEGLQKTTGLAFRSQDSLATLFYDFFLQTMKQWRDTFKEWFLAAWAIAVFFIVRGFGVVYRYAVSLFAFVAYETLLATGVIRIAGESRIREIIEYT